MQTLGIRNDVGHRRVSGVHHALGFTGCARGVNQLCHIVWAWTVLLEQGCGLRVFLPFGAAEQSFKTVGPFAVNHHHMLQMRQAGLEVAHHFFVVKATESLRNDEHLGFTMFEHERQLAFTENMHQRVHHRTNARACQIGDGELPPIGQLTSHHIVARHTQFGQTHSHTVCHVGQLAIGEPCDFFSFSLHSCDRHFVGATGHTGV